MGRSISCMDAVLFWDSLVLLPRQSWKLEYFFENGRRLKDVRQGLQTILPLDLGQFPFGCVIESVVQQIAHFPPPSRLLSISTV